MKLTKHGRITGRARQAYQRARQQRRWDEGTVDEYLFGADERREPARVVPVIRGDERLTDVSAIPVAPAAPAVQDPTQEVAAGASTHGRERPNGRPALAAKVTAPVVRQPSPGVRRPATRAAAQTRLRMVVAGLGGIAAGLAFVTVVKLLLG